MSVEKEKQNVKKSLVKSIKISKYSKYLQEKTPFTNSLATKNTTYAIVKTMDFLFAPLPETNFQMNTEELRLWQRNAIFECECDNFINRRIETGQLGRPFFELSAINSAIQSQGLRLPGMHANTNQRSNVDDTDEHNEDDESHTDANANLTPPLRQRRRLMPTDPEQDRGNMLDRIYQEALYTAFRTRGLSAIRNPYYS